MARHRNGQNCPSCLNKLQGCHPDLLNLYQFISSKHPDAHISWGYRDQEDQNEALKCGKSDLPWPKSPHNHMNENGVPQSWATDYFRQDNFGNGHFERSFCQTLWDEISQMGFNIRWGGKFKSLGDFDHFERFESFTNT